MSAAPERLFSGAKISITDRRNRLGIASINAQFCLKSWYKVLSRQNVTDCDTALQDLAVEMTKIEEEYDTQLAMELESLEREIGVAQID
jgi:hypothetical protein